MYAITLVTKQQVSTEFVHLLPVYVGSIRLSAKMFEQVEVHGKVMIERLETDEAILILKEGAFEMVDTDPFIIN